MHAILEGLDPRKRIASIFLTPVCGMACRFCASETRFSVMSFDRAADLLAALKGRMEHVVLGGGEPFAWPHDVVKLAALARDMGFHVQICTNGIDLPEGFETLPAIDRFILPVESVDPALHDRLRRSRDGGHHRLVMDRIRALARAGREFTLSTVVTRENLAGLEDMAAWLRREGRAGTRLHAWHLYRFLPVGRGGARAGARLEVERDEYVQACDRMQNAGLPFRVYRRDDMRRASTVEFFWFEGDRLCLGSRLAQVGDR